MPNSLSELAAREKKILQEEEAARDRGGEEGNEVVTQRVEYHYAESSPTRQQMDHARTLKAGVDGLRETIDAVERALAPNGKRSREFALARTHLEDAGMRIQRGILMKV